jgi:hypothetical protein
MLTSDLGVTYGFQAVQTKYEDKELSGGYTSDLLSDVMGNAAEGNVLVTIQAHKNTVAVASLVGLAAIVVCNDRSVPEDMVEAAATEGIAIFRTGASQFEVSGRLWPGFGRR